MKKRQTFTSLGRRTTSFLKDFVRPDTAQTVSAPSTLPGYTTQETPPPCVPAGQQGKTETQIFADSHCTSPIWHTGTSSTPVSDALFAGSLAPDGCPTLDGSSVVPFRGNLASKDSTGDSALIVGAQEMQYWAPYTWSNGDFINRIASAPDQQTFWSYQAWMDNGCHDKTGTRYTTINYSFEGGWKSDPPRRLLFMPDLSLGPIFYVDRYPLQTSNGRRMTWTNDFLDGGFGKMIYFGSDMFAPELGGVSRIDDGILPLLDQWLYIPAVGPLTNTYVPTGMRGSEVSITIVNSVTANQQTTPHGSSAVYMGPYTPSVHDATISDYNNLFGLKVHKIFDCTRSMDFSDLMPGNWEINIEEAQTEIWQYGPGCNHGPRNTANSNFAPMTVTAEATSYVVSDAAAAALVSGAVSEVAMLNAGANHYIPAFPTARFSNYESVFVDGLIVSPSLYTVAADFSITFTYPVTSKDVIAYVVTL